MATLNTDRNAWAERWCETPLGPPESREARAKLEPGTCVKNRTLTRFGRVHKNTPEEVIVIGYGHANTEDEKFVWTGSQAEFIGEWKID